MDNYISKPATSFAQYIHDISANIQQKIAMSTQKYKFAIDTHHRNVMFNEDDYRMVRIHPKCYPKHLFKKLHARATDLFYILHKLEPNTYYLELPSDLKFSLVFNIADLFPYRDIFEPPMHAYILTGCTTSSSMPVLVLPSVPSLLPDCIVRIITGKIVYSAHGRFQKFLVKWQDRPNLDAT